MVAFAAAIHLRDTVIVVTMQHHMDTGGYPSESIKTKVKCANEQSLYDQAIIPIIETSYSPYDRRTSSFTLLP